MFSKTDLLQIEAKKISLDTINRQILQFKTGFPFLNIKKPATVGNGIFKLSEKQIQHYLNVFLSESSQAAITKFVPASGAATRMFKELYEYIADNMETSLKYSKYFTNKTIVSQFFENIEKFSFYDLLNSKFTQNYKLSVFEGIKHKMHHQIIETLLFDKGLNYGNLPKGLLHFHKYTNYVATPVEEHIKEAVNYSSDNQIVTIHFTVSPEHLSPFTQLANQLIEKYQNQTKKTIQISFSIQNSSTDTLAVNESNEPFRNTDNSLLFRPGGHGALIDNMNNLQSRIVFIKNIDNIAPDTLKEPTYLYKKAMCGMVFELKNNITKLLNALENKQTTAISDSEMFLKHYMSFEFPETYFTTTHTEKTNYLWQKLNRPIRVCGMVKNQGEPGGGPYLAQNYDGSYSLQILESSQLNLRNQDIKNQVENATHFNPVNLVCDITNYKGEKFNLNNFIDINTGFISEKSKDGKTLKALELPGLWNGAMSDWNTVFIEVPIETFNPVKSINDLLRPEHQ